MSSLVTAATPVVPSSEGPAEITACWNDIGVNGKGTCPELDKFVHCRNCPVYSTAGARLLDRDLPAEYRQEWTDRFAVARTPQEPGRLSVVLFRIRAEWLALPTQVFQEVSEPRKIHSLPHRSLSLVLGLANFRGELLICVSLGQLLGLELPGQRAERACGYHRLLVVSWDGSRLAFPVDEVQGPNRFHVQEVKAPPATLAGANFNLTQGMVAWQERSVGLLNAQAVFFTLHQRLA